MTSDVQELQAALKKAKAASPSYRYQDPALREKIASVTAGLLASGLSWWGASKKLGITFVTLKTICEAKPLRVTNGHATTNGHSTNGHARLTVHTANGHRIDGLAEPGPLVLVTKDGHRVEGLTVETLAQLLARL